MALRWSQVSVVQAEIFVDRYPLRSGRRKRTKESTAAVRHLCLDLDTDREARLLSLRVSDSLPTPITFISTLPGIPRDLWRVESFPIEPQGSALNMLAIGIRSDPTCTDCNRVLLRPRILNCKYDPAYPVTVKYHGDSTWNSDAFRLDILAEMPSFRLAHSERERIPLTPQIPNMIGRGFCMSLAAERMRETRAKAGFAPGR
jgi:hypothetical protein